MISNFNQVVQAVKQYVEDSNLRDDIQAVKDEYNSPSLIAELKHNLMEDMQDELNAYHAFSVINLDNYNDGPDYTPTVLPLLSDAIDLVINQELAK